MNEIESPRVTVVIPSFNHAYFIGQAIQSVLDQAFGDFEIIVVDDGSTDGSRDVIDRFGTQVVYVRQENRGLSAARNTGVRMARGEFVGFLYADD
ncbi:MAG: glycosyltransferase family 2 protein, partial [Anaerolineales bacterium]